MTHYLAQTQSRRSRSARWSHLLLWIVAAVVALPIYANPSSCKEFLEYGVPSQSDALLCRTGFALSHDSSTKSPRWVAQRMTPERLIAAVPRSDRFIPDPDLPKGQRAELEDYRASGYDRGHMAPAADMRWSAQAMRESFYLSNMAPQIGTGFNRGIWSDLESRIRQWVERRGELFIFTGPVFEIPITKAPKIGPSAVAVPTHFYKIVFDPVRVETIAFVIPNTAHQGRRLEEFITSVRDIEQRTGLDFLNRITPGVQALIEEAVAVGLW
ncbi:MAG: hypothetical protein RJA58_728 [Pseudomonadota bacterium]